jgi:plastocyanin
MWFAVFFPTEGGKDMKKAWFPALIAVALLSLFILAGCGSKTTGTTTQDQTTTQNSGNTTTAQTGPVSINIKGFAFQPADVTIKAGSEVTWINDDSATHTVVGNGFESGNLATGQTYKHTFDAAGVYSYHCGIHPNMQGKITVQ